MEHREDLTTLLGIAGRPVRVHEAATALEIDLEEVVRLSESLAEQGIIADTADGLVLAGEQEPPPPSRQAYVANKWAKALAELDASPVEIGRALLAAGQFRAAGEHLLPVALSDRALEAVEGALEATRRGVAISPQDEGRLRLARAIHRRARGESAGASEDLEVAVRRLQGPELVDALGFSAAVADDLQHPQDSETYTAMAEAQAALLGETAKLGSLLTLHGRQLSRIGFPDEADRVLRLGQGLVDEHGTSDQRHRCRLNHAWVSLDRGQMRQAEAAYAILRDQARDMDPVDLADRDAYWARTLFGIGHAADALEAATRAEEVARASDAEAPLMIAELARMEGATLFGRHEDAVEHAEKALQIAERALPAWRNVALVGMARALAAAGRREEAEERVEAAFEATPPGANGWRQRIQARELALVLTPESERWPQRDAEDLTDALLQARWFGSAVHLMAERARRESDKELGLEAAALALQNGNPMLAALAVEAAEAWDDPTVAPVARAVQALEPQMPPQWLEEWRTYPPVASAYRVEVDEEVDPSALEQRIDEALRTAGLSGVDMVLSPAQRRARGLVRRRPIRGRRVLTVLGSAAAVVLLSGLTALAVIIAQPDPPVPTLPTTAPAPPTTLALEDRIVDVPELGVFGQALHRGGSSRAGVSEGGLAMPRGIYWRAQPGGLFGTEPVAYGRVLYIGSSTDDKLFYLDQETGRVMAEIPTGDRVRSSPVVELTGEVTYLIFGADDETVYATNALTATGAVLWREPVSGIVSAAPLLVEGTIVVATEAGELVALRLTGPDPVTNETVLWRYRGTDEVPLAPVNTAPAYASGVVFVVDQEGWLHVVDLATGEPACRPFKAFAPLDRGSNPIVSGEFVYLPTTGGLVHVLNAEPCNGQSVHRRAEYQAFGEPFRQPPAIADEVMYVLQGQFLHAIDALTGELSVWASPFDAGDRLNTAPIVASGVVFVGTQSGLVFAVDAAEGTELWRFDVGEPISGIAVVKNAVFVTTAEGTVVAIAGESETE